VQQVTVSRVLLVALGGVLGSLARFAIEQSAPLVHSTIWATFVVNLVGCFAIGLVAARLTPTTPPWVHVFFVTGLLGGFTTFSAFATEVVITVNGSEFGTALLYMGATLIMGLLAVPLGVRASALFGTTPRRTSP
jgi:fluoride exporter